MIGLYEYIIEGLLDNKLLRPLRNFIYRNFKKKAGFKENIKISIQGDEYTFTATMDTGNGGVVPTLGVDKMELNDNKVKILIGDKEYTFDKKGEASPTVGNVVHHRPIILIDYIEIKGRRLDEPFIAVTDERKKSTQSLINRDTMSKLNLVIDPSKNSLIHEKLHITKNTKVFNDEEFEKVLGKFGIGGIVKPYIKDWFTKYGIIDIKVYGWKGINHLMGSNNYIEEMDTLYKYVHNICNDKNAEEIKMENGRNLIFNSDFFCITAEDYNPNFSIVLKSI